MIEQEKIEIEEDEGEKMLDMEEEKGKENEAQGKSSSEETERESKAEVKSEDKARWWVIKVKGGKEDFVKEEIEKLMKEDSRIKEVFVPEEEEKYKRKTKGGEKELVRKKKILPGYIYVKMDLDENLWQKIRSVPNVSMFLGERGIPIPVSSEKIESLKSKTLSGEIAQLTTITIGDRVRIKSGPLKGFAGIVESISEDKNKIRILITIFGRQTPVEIETNQVEKET